MTDGEYTYFHTEDTYDHGQPLHSTYNVSSFILTNNTLKFKFIYP